MASLTVAVRVRIRGLVVARTLGHLPGSIGRWSRCRVRVEAQIGNEPWVEIGRWEEPARA